MSVLIADARMMPPVTPQEFLLARTHASAQQGALKHLHEAYMLPAAGKEGNKENESLLAESNGHHEPLQVRSINVGVRSCFFWLSEHAERSMSMEERSTWMEATGKGECQDATLCSEAFNGLQGAALTGNAAFHTCKKKFLVPNRLAKTDSRGLSAILRAVSAQTWYKVYWSHAVCISLLYLIHWGVKSTTGVQIF